MNQKTYFIIDFDSTFIQSEGLDELAEVVLKKNPQRNKILKEIKDITRLGMEGRISFGQSLDLRLSLLTIHFSDIEKLVTILKKKISKSILRNKAFFDNYRDQIYIVSGGFREYVVPVVARFKILEDHIFANKFIFDKKGKVVGYDKKNPLSQKNGKLRVIKSLHLDGELLVIGDGYTDYQIKKLGFAHKFIAFTENIKRETIAQKADHVAPSFDEFLFINKLPASFSYPKNRIKVLLLDGIEETAGKIFEKEGFSAEQIQDYPSEEILKQKIQDASVVCIRSKTKFTESVIETTHRLISIGRFGIGVDNIDLAACSQKGIAVFNAPYSSTRSVVELVLGSIVMLLRGIFDKSMKMHQGIWDKSTKDSHEVRQKTLGIIGYGNIGSQLSVLAEALGMNIVFYDIVEKMPLGNAKQCRNLSELLKISDVISVHMSGNTALLGEKEFTKMKNGVYIANTSRGKVIDILSLVKYIKLGKVKGAAIDVFPYEPKVKGEPFTSELQKLPNVILTPHIAGTTEEAQKNIAEFVSSKIIDFINTGNTHLSLNLPNIQLPPLRGAHRLLHLHANVPGILAKINSILAKHGINILGQYLKTNEQIGYVITDVNKKYDKKVLGELKKISHTIRFRVLY